MRINPIINNTFHRPDAEARVSKAPDIKPTAYSAPSKVDRIEVSSKAYEALADDEKLTATSGKDDLIITRGAKENSFIIHFPDSASVSRTVTRGYITINGTRIELPDDIKKQLMQTDRQAQKDRDLAFSKYVMEHELAVSKQQSSVMKKMADDTSRAFAIASKLSKGQKVPPSEERELLEFNPQLYTISKLIAEMAKQQGKQDKEGKDLPDRKEDDQALDGVDWSDFECKSYETRLALELSDTVQFQGVTEGAAE